MRRASSDAGSSVVLEAGKGCAGVRRGTQLAAKAGPWDVSGRTESSTLIHRTGGLDGRFAVARERNRGMR